MSHKIKKFKHQPVLTLLTSATVLLLTIIAASSSTDLSLASTRITADQNTPQTVNRITAPASAELHRKVVKLSTQSGPSASRTSNQHVKPVSQLHDSIWPRLSSNFQLSTLSHPDIDKQIRFMKNGIHSLRSNLTNARPYLHFIIEEIERAGLPPDLALLPLIESAYNPVAVSNMKAAGLWQFMPATAKSYGLQKNDWYDGRKDVVASTHAAIRYLKHLNETFDGDWLLAIAAYNTGPGNVRSAIRKATAQGLPTDFWHLRLAKETRKYVPRLIAVVKMIANPESFGFELPAIDNRKYLDTVSVGRRISLKQAAHFARVPHATLASLNTGFSRDSTPPDGPHSINIPANSVHTLLAQLTVHKRDLQTDFKPQIPQEKNHTRPATGVGIITPAPAPAARQSSKNNLKEITFKPYKTYHYESHIISKGDNLWTLSRKIGTSIDTLMNWNEAARDSATLRVGTKMHVAFMRTENQKTEKTTILHYLVDPNDTLSAIADKFATKISTIKKWNPSLWTRNHVQSGQSIRVPVQLQMPRLSNYSFLDQSTTNTPHH